MQEKFHSYQWLPLSCRRKDNVIKGIIKFCFRLQMLSKCMVIALILIYDISSVPLWPKIAMKVILEP